jgi:hypothetical protein
MPDTLGRVIRLVPAGTSSTSNLFSELRPLSSGAVQIALTSSLNHLGDESAYRQLASVPGFGVGGVEVARNSPTSASPARLPSDFDWFSPAQYTPFTEYPAASICFGSHPIHRVARASATWPKLVLRARVDPPTTSADKLYACLAVVPGANGGSPASITESSLFALGEVVGGSGWSDLEIALPLAAESVAPLAVRPLLGAPSSGVPGDSELVLVNLVTVWCSFYTSEVGGKACQVIAVTLSLEPS